MDRFITKNVGKDNGTRIDSSTDVFKIDFTKRGVKGSEWKIEE